MKIQVLYEKEAKNSDFVCGWGLSYLINDTILFDTAEKSQYLASNAKACGLDLTKIEKVIISHNHWDHLGGLGFIIENNPKAKLHVCSQISNELKRDDKLCISQDFEKIAENIYLSGIFNTIYKEQPLEEQALYIKGDKGVSIICGCAHPGLLEIVSSCKEKLGCDKIYAVVGGFHFIDKDSRFINYVGQQLKEMGVENIGPGHCTGFEAIKTLKNIYNQGFIDVKSGSEIIV